ncbi:MAG: DUF459 domain-containing protein [Candidatus Dojkabacteria bacterium]
MDQQQYHHLFTLISNNKLVHKEFNIKSNKGHSILNDISVVVFVAVILLFFFIIDPSGVQAIIERDNIFIKHSSLNAPAAQNNLGSKKSVTELLASQPQFELKPLKPQKPNPVSEGSYYLIMGDSMMQQGIGSSLENDLLTGKVSGVTREAIQSTGLLHPERLDWYSRASQLADQTHPAVAVVMWGLNDLDNIYDWNTGRSYLYGNDDWKLAYAQKVDQMINILLNEKGIKKVFWIGLPIAREENWNYGIRIENEVFKTVASRYINAVYVDTFERFAVNGAYSETVTDDRGNTQFARQADGVHVNLFGGEIMADLIVKSMRDHDVHF